MKAFLSKCSLFAKTASLCLLGGLALASDDRSETSAALRALHQHQAELAELGEERAEHDEIAQLADTLRQDHAILDEWLAEADGGEASVETGDIAHDAEAYAALQQQEGEAFDAAYLAYQERLHTAALDYLERQRSEEESELTEFDNHLRVTHEALRKHLALIQALR